jgi:crotonobetainyl-CoA:carnitine CoA-transferase CaiB-like acyl-CoA transferase
MSSHTFLDDVRVVTMAQYVPGPLAAARLHDAGARVVKIEPPAGDPLLELSRAWYDELHVGITVERVDLKTADGHARVLTLLADADVFITSQRPSTLRRLGLDPDALRTTAPAVRVLSIVGSVRAPERAGHDLTYQAQAGLLDGAMPRTLAADVMASERVFATALALLRQPPGATMDVGLVESLDPLIAPLRHGLTSPSGTLGGAAPRYRVYRSKVGHVAIAALEPHFERRLYDALGLALHADMSAVLRERSAADWEQWAAARDLPVVALHDAGER